MGFEIVDRYLLGEPVSKAEVVAAFLTARSGDPLAAPFYRALEAVGVRAADEAFLALRLVLAGRAPEDEAVRRLRAFSFVARAAARGDRPGVEGLFKRERAVLAELGAPQAGVELAAIGARASAAYRAELEGKD